MKSTKARDLAIAVVVAGILVNLFLRTSYDTMPRLPVLAGLTLLALAVIEGLLTVALRPRLQRKPDTRPVRPDTAVRVLALAKASSLLGAIMVGAWAGLLVYVAPRAATVEAAAGDTTSGVIGLVCSAALIAAALWLEYSCRVRKPGDRGDDDRDRDIRGS